MPAYFPNRYAGKCCRCSSKVIAGAGICQRDAHGPGWLIGCNNCFPGEVNNAYASQAESAAKAQSDLDALEARRQKILAERQALLDKLGIDFKDVRNEKYVQNAWSDDSTWEVPYTGEGTVAEFEVAVRTPAQSLSGALRASQGVRLVSVDPARKVITLFESVALCD